MSPKVNAKDDSGSNRVGHARFFVFFRIGLVSFTYNVIFCFIVRLKMKSCMCVFYPGYIYDNVKRNFHYVTDTVILIKHFILKQLNCAFACTKTFIHPLPEMIIK